MNKETIKKRKVEDTSDSPPPLVTPPTYSGSDADPPPSKYKIPKVKQKTK